MRVLSLATALAVVATAASANADTLAAGAPSTTFDVADYVTGPAQITDFRFLPDGRLVMIGKGGQVRVRTTAGAVVTAGSFPVDSSSEKGLLGVEVDPAFATTNRLFFYYSRASGGSDGGTDTDRHRVVSITLKSDNTLDMATEKILVRGLRGPANHDGGGLAISKDGKLFIGVGDTGCNSGLAPGGSITNYFGTCLTNGNGKILRVNLDGTIPSDNPLVGVAAVTACGSTCGTNISTTGTAAPRQDIWAWGFRNPWRFSVDPVTGNLWVGDVGEVTFEEVAVVPKGRHMGWPFREGAAGYPATKCTEITPNTGNCVDPSYYCRHGGASGGVDGGCTSITGGVIVDSCDWPDTFRGLYFFADNATNALWTLQPNAARDGIVAGSRKDFGSVTGGPVSMRTGPDGALYVASLGGARIARFAPKSPVTCTTPDGGVPDTGTVEDTGAVEDTGTGATDSGTSTSDASTVDDSGVTPAAGVDDGGGCGCVTVGTRTMSSAPLLAFIALGLVRRRRNRG